MLPSWIMNQRTYVLLSCRDSLGNLLMLLLQQPHGTRVPVTCVWHDSIQRPCMSQGMSVLTPTLVDQGVVITERDELCCRSNYALMHHRHVYDRGLPG